MKKKNLSKINTRLVTAVVVVCVALLVYSCEKYRNHTSVTPKGVQTSVDTIRVEIDGYTFISTLQDRPNGEVWGVINGTNNLTGETEMWQYPLGGVNFSITPHDTIDGTPSTTHGNFTQTVDSTVYDDMEVYHLVRNMISFTDEYSLTTYTLNGEVTWLNGSCECWGYNISFPRRTVELEWGTVNSSEAGSDASYDYTLLKTTYNLKYLGAIVPKYGLKTTRREKGSDVLIDSAVVSQGWIPLTYTSFGWPSTAKSWIDVVYTYSLSGPTPPQRIEVILNYNINKPADTTLIANDFNLSWANPQAGQVVTGATTTAPNGANVVTKWQNYSVGATGLFTRVFKYTWEEASWHGFPLPSYGFTNYSETHVLNDMSQENGYDRKKAINTVTATLNGISGAAPANTIIKVQAEDPDTPDDPTDELVSRNVINEGLTYVNPTTNISWLTIREIWTVSGTHEYNVQVNLTNGMTSPAEGPFFVGNFNEVSQIGPGATGTEQTVGQPYYNGDFKIQRYKKTFSVNIGVTNLVWTGTYEKPIYVPLNYAMPSSAYTYAVSSGAYDATPLSQSTSSGVVYNRQLWRQNITAQLNAHTQPYDGTAEIWALDEIPRQSPDLFGNLLDARYSRVQPAVNQGFQDCVSFLYENGVVLFINGNTNNPLLFAKTASVAQQLGIPQMGNPNAWYSAEYHDGGWWPAKITPTGDWTAWTYIADASNTHSVDRNDALILGIGYDYHPIPTHQEFIKNGNVGTISYSANNTSGTMTASITYW